MLVGRRIDSVVSSYAAWRSSVQKGRHLASGDIGDASI